MQIILNTKLDDVVKTVKSQIAVYNLNSIGNVKETSRNFSGTVDGYVVDASSLLNDINEISNCISLFKMTNINTIVLYNEKLLDDYLFDVLKSYYDSGVRSFVSYEDLATKNLASIFDFYPRNFNIESLRTLHAELREDQSEIIGTKTSLNSSLLVFYSPLTVGVSTIASSVAYLLASDKKVAFVDLSRTQTGYYSFGVTHETALTSLIQFGRDEPFVYSKNLQVYADKPLIDGFKPKANGLSNVLASLKKNYDVVVVDLSYLGADSSKVTSDIFNLADSVYIIGDCKASSKEILPKHIIDITSSMYSVNLVITNIANHVKFDKKEYVSHFKKVQTDDKFVDCRIAEVFEVSSDIIAVVNSFNTGAPAVIDADCEFTQDIKAIISALFGSAAFDEDTREQKDSSIGGVFKKLFSK